MGVIFHEQAKEFHLYNEEVSYIMQILNNGYIGNLYYGKRIHDKEDFTHLLQEESVHLQSITKNMNTF